MGFVTSADFDEVRPAYTVPAGVLTTLNVFHAGKCDGLLLLTFSSSTMGSPEETLQVGESATYTATYMADHGYLYRNQSNGC